MRGILLGLLLWAWLPLGCHSQTIQLPREYGATAGAQMVTIPLTVHGFARAHITSVEADIVFNRRYLRATGIEVSGTLAEQWTAFYNVINDTLRIAAASAYDLSGDGVLLRVVFDVRPETPDTLLPLRLSRIILNKSAPAHIQSGSIRVQRTNAARTHWPQRPLLFTPDPTTVDSRTMIHFWCPQPALVTAVVYRAATPVDTLVRNRLLTQGHWFLTWVGGIVPGDYRAQVTIDHWQAQTHFIYLP